MSDLWSRASTARASARLLLDGGDADGAISRAYYAMFDAARAALKRIDPQLIDAKTHATIIRRFGQHVVVDNGLDGALGRSLNAAEKIRLVADYRTTVIPLADAEQVLRDMERFLDAVE